MGGGEKDEEFGGEEVFFVFFFCRNREEERRTTREQWKEREKDIRGKRRDRPQQGDELLVKWLLFSSRASQLPFFGSSFSVPQSDTKHKRGKNSSGRTQRVMGSFTYCQVSVSNVIFGHFIVFVLQPATSS